GQKSAANDPGPGRHHARGPSGGRRHQKGGTASEKPPQRRTKAEPPKPSGARKLTLMRAITHGLLGALFILVLGPRLYAAESLWKAGVAKADITPAEPVWLAGYGGPARPAHGKVMELWIKALALEDAQGHRSVIVTSDTLGIPQSIYRTVSAALKEKSGLAPEQIILSASHTHCGPVLRNALYDMYPV